MDKKLFPTCLAVVLCCLFSLPLFSAPVSSDECNAPAPGNFRKTAEGPGYVTLGWEPVESGASHLLTVSEVLADGSETLVYTFDGISAVTKKVDGLKQRTRYKFKIYTKCADGNPSLIPSEVDIITLIIELTLAGRKPVNPQPVGCSGIEYNNPENEWVGFRIYRFDEGKIIENLFEFERIEETNNVKIKRVEQENILVAANEANKFPVELTDIIFSNNPFNLGESSINGDSILLFGRIKVELNGWSSGTVSLCPDGSGWNQDYFYEPMTAQKVEGPIKENDTQYDILGKEKSTLSIHVNNPIGDFLLLSPSGNYSAENSISIMMVDVNGRIVINEKRKLSGDTEVIDTSSVSQGVYYLKLVVGESSSTSVVMKLN
ncbi:MAG: T9SS type A sorting domain-containing protein [Bacteroidota bacterium]